MRKHILAAVSVSLPAHHVSCARGPLQRSIQFAIACLASPVSPSVVLLWPWNHPSAVAFGRSGRRCHTKSSKRLPRSQLLLRRPRPPAIGGDRCLARAGARSGHVALPLMAVGVPPPLKAPGTGAAAFVIGTTWTLPWALRVAGRSWPAS